MEPYRVIIEGGEGEIAEKKSRFIATVGKAKSEEEAAAFVEAVKKRYWDARHNCFAYVLGERGEYTKCSDDGEPSGTAGRPMLAVLTGEELRNTVVVVTRYFGGVLLGTGGLVRAYTQAVKEGLANCVVGTVRAGVRLEMTTDYNGVGKILYILNSHGIQPAESEYTDEVKLGVVIPAEQCERLQKEITEATAGRTKMSVSEEIQFIERQES